MLGVNSGIETKQVAAAPASQKEADYKKNRLSRPDGNARSRR
jgi:hypothetical protein